MKKVFTTGTFDILHYGHISFLRRARALGDYLIVGVNVKPDGKTPFYSFEERKEILLSLKFVDEVVPIYRQEDKFNFLRYVDIFACGAEYRGYYDIPRIQQNVKVVFLERTPGISTTLEKQILPEQERFYTLCIDIDNTICYTVNRDFENSIPVKKVIDKINAFYRAGWKIILSTARGAKSCKTIEERIAKYDALTRAWLEKNNVLYNELWFGKPNADFYIDDKNLSINEFLDFQHVNELSNVEKLYNFVKEEKDILTSNCKNDGIDIIVPWVDCNDVNWITDYNKYRKQEIKEGKQRADNLQAFGVERTRDWGAFKYWFRGVEKNCPWVRKVFLVVQRESQIPEWLNKENPKLRIVFHDEFIPNELLPTFSTLVIETFYFRIADLSNHFIVCNDDFYFLNPIKKEYFFDNDNVYYGGTGYRNYNWGNGNSVWGCIVKNNNDFIKQHITGPIINFIHYSHLPDARVKAYEIDFISKYYDEILQAMSVSRFRHEKNLIPSLLYIDGMKYQKFSKFNAETYSKSCYAELSCYTNWNGLKNKEMVCLNDTANSNYKTEEVQTKMIHFLEELLPNKCSFEK